MDPETRAVYAKKAFIHRIWFKCLAFCLSSFGVYAFLFSGFNVESEAREIKEDPRKIFENYFQTLKKVGLLGSQSRAISLSDFALLDIKMRPSLL